MDCGKTLYARAGFRGLWVGFGACAIKGSMQGAIEFLVFEILKAQFNK